MKRWRALWWFAGGVGVALLTAVVGQTDSGGPRRGGTLVILAHAALGPLDTQTGYGFGWPLLVISHDGLVGFRRKGGRAGTQIVPDLASAVPRPTQGGRTYTFRVRRGIRYSNGLVVRPSDFRHTFERMFKVHAPTAGTFYRVIVGADRCLKQPNTCRLARGVVPDDSRYAVTFHLTRPDPEFLYKLAMPFALVLPPGTPDKEVSVPPPGTGPYAWTSYNPSREAKLVRNPYFHVWSRDAQPPGNPDVIVEKFGLTVEAEVTQVENGQADWLIDLIPSDRLPELGTRFASQVHIRPLAAVYYAALNVRQPPFDSLAARRALNYATDRSALVKIYGGPRLAGPTCQILPPDFPGYAPYCPYTKHPGPRWSTPNLAKARKLIAASGTKGEKVRVTTTTSEVGKAFGLYFVGLLDKLGYRASLQPLSAPIEYAYCQNSKNKVQFCYTAWSQDYPAASDFVNVLFGCASFNPASDTSPNISEFCDRGIQNGIDRALQLEVTDPKAANALWAKLDREITDLAPFVGWFNPRNIDFVSKRVTGYQFHPVWYFLMDQASIS